MTRTKVVAVSGASGAGKTTIVKNLANLFNCPFLIFDNYTDIDTYPNDMKNWLDNGANVNLIKTPRFASAIKDCLAKSTSRYIFIEEPFGKGRSSLFSIIDHVILLDQPLALCLTRIKARHNKKSLACFMTKYDDYFKGIYEITVHQARSNSDLILNEVISISETTNRISFWLNHDANYLNK